MGSEFGEIKKGMIKKYILDNPDEFVDILMSDKDSYIVNQITSKIDELRYPEPGAKFWYVNHIGNAICGSWDSSTHVCKNMFEFGNVFLDPKTPLLFGRYMKAMLHLCKYGILVYDLINTEMMHTDRFESISSIYLSLSSDFESCIATIYTRQHAAYYTSCPILFRNIDQLKKAIISYGESDFVQDYLMIGNCVDISRVDIKSEDE